MHGEFHMLPPLHIQAPRGDVTKTWELEDVPTDWVDPSGGWMRGVAAGEACVGGLEGHCHISQPAL